MIRLLSKMMLRRRNRSLGERGPKVGDGNPNVVADGIKARSGVKIAEMRRTLNEGKQSEGGY